MKVKKLVSLFLIASVFCLSSQLFAKGDRSLEDKRSKADHKFCKGLLKSAGNQGCRALAVVVGVAATAKVGVAGGAAVGIGTHLGCKAVARSKAAENFCVKAVDTARKFSAREIGREQ